MRNESGQCQGPQLILHGGAGPMDPEGDRIVTATGALRDIAAALFEDLKFGREAREVALECVKAMERHEMFNAGRGSAMQRDGGIRMSAAFMDGNLQSFSGVMGVESVLHPSVMAEALQTESARVLGPPGTELLARRLGLPVADLVTEARLADWQKRRAKGGDTVGCVVRSAQGHLFAVTSTGGRGYEEPGRLSDSATVAGNYCSRFCAVGATGVGEQLVDDAMAARLETRVRDGMTLAQASTKCFEEAKERTRHYGWIALDSIGWSVAHTTQGMTFVVFGEEGELLSS